MFYLVLQVPFITDLLCLAFSFIFSVNIPLFIQVTLPLMMLKIIQQRNYQFAIHDMTFD